jgi:hypothetical protein
LHRLGPAAGEGNRRKASAIVARAISKDRNTRFENFDSKFCGTLILLVAKLGFHSVKCLAVFFCAKVPSACRPCTVRNETASVAGWILPQLGNLCRSGDFIQRDEFFTQAQTAYGSSSVSQ